MDITSWIRPAKDFSSNSAVATIGIRRIDRNQFHVGIFYRNRDTREDRILHLAFHCDLRDQLLEEDLRYYWVIPNLPEMRQVQISALCRLVVRNNAGSIPYGLRYNRSTFFTQQGELIVGTECSGLTCATFIIAVFERAGVRLVNIHDWPTRDEDKQWHNEIISVLETECEHVEHVNRVKKEYGCSRFRPQEVCASILFEPKPAEFIDIETSAKQIENFLSN
jgi:hypothetical protein